MHSRLDDNTIHRLGVAQSDVEHIYVSDGARRRRAGFHTEQLPPPPPENPNCQTDTLIWMKAYRFRSALHPFGAASGTSE